MTVKKKPLVRNVVVKKQPDPPSHVKLGTVFLVVDDDKGARQIVVDYLKSFGYRNILEAKDGGEALQYLRSEKIDFVISDWEMPTANGIELLRALKTDPKLNGIPFVMVTSPVSQEKLKIEDAAAAKVDGYVIKPFRSDVLKEKIDQILTQNSMESRRGALVVDDDDGVRSTVVDYLTVFGYAPIYQASNGGDGFLILKAHAAEIAFIVSDWEMPRMAGIDLLKRIRADESLHALPFIMMTSQTSIERLKISQAMNADVDDYLLKPFKGDDLRLKVAEMLNRAKALASVTRELAHARGLLEEGRWSEALKLFHSVIKTHPGSVEAYLGLATAQKHIAPETAIPNATQYLRKAIELNPRYARSHIDLALIFESAMSLGKAITCLIEALKTCPLSEEVHYHLGRIMLRTGNKLEGRRELERALELKPDYEEARELLGENNG
jgi:CheY-like chemotaxis protein/Flp pilus assembly protein TadD